MKIVLLAVGKTSSGYLKEAIEAFAGRISHYLKFETVEIADIKSSKGMDPNSQKRKEGEQLLSALQPGDIAVLLDERGKELTSREFADYLGRHMLSGTKRLVFVIGGPYGFSQEVYDKSSERLSLSKMTFTHQMARLFFVEQIYRAMTILKGEPYHHD